MHLDGHLSHEIEEIEQRLDNIEASLQALVDILSTPVNAKLILSFAAPISK